jgi:hypothetical protein
MVWNGEKSLASARNRTLAIQHVASQYTDWTILAPITIIKIAYNHFPPKKKGMRWTKILDTIYEFSMLGLL